MASTATNSCWFLQDNGSGMRCKVRWAEQNAVPCNTVGPVRQGMHQRGMPFPDNMGAQPATPPKQPLSAHSVLLWSMSAAPKMRSNAASSNW